MIIFFVRAVTLNGFQHGLYYLFFPKVCTTESLNGCVCASEYVCVYE